MNIDPFVQFGHTRGHTSSHESLVSSLSCKTGCSYLFRSVIIGDIKDILQQFPKELNLASTML